MKQTFDTLEAVIAFSVWLSVNCTKKATLSQINGLTYEIQVDPADAEKVQSYFTAA